ncbi:hypothetical protein J6590_029730 [Homalodisca vitripennis]|nr:hypothetical protein J6590_029730 [Homalodisca vitripennis]
MWRGCCTVPTSSSIWKLDVDGAVERSGFHDLPRCDNHTRTKLRELGGLSATRNARGPLCNCDSREPQSSGPNLGGCVTSSGIYRGLERPDLHTQLTSQGGEDAYLQEMSRGLLCNCDSREPQSSGPNLGGCVTSSGIYRGLERPDLHTQLTSQGGEDAYLQEMSRGRLRY